MRFEIPQWLKYEIEERWQQFRELINKNPKAVWGITCASVFIFLLTIIFLLSGGDSRPETKEVKKAWFYDLNTGRLFKAKDELQGPIEAPSGPLPSGESAGVRAYVYTYENEPDENELIIGYLEKPDPNAPDTANTGGLQMGQGKLIRTVDNEKWIPSASKKGREILKEVTKRDERGRIPRYYPPR
ncbi:MAG: hypothetical protein JW804_00020 [Sedimentisphaerales bacterium]|nr:hypothetical protein [Sedimentisphaerales bacterium]